jgi:hypothetical protein
MASLLTGRGLWYGHPHVFSLAEWETCCQQAHAWGIQVLHPKVADAENPNILWYDVATLEKLRDIAVSTYHLQVAPWMWTYGGTLIEREAQAAYTIGNIFGSVILDIEDAWSGHDDWAQQFGLYLYHMGYTKQVYATVYANPEEHPTPIEALNPWITGFLPQVYFAAWSPQGASNAITYFLPQWERIEASLQTKKQVLKPILPIISLEYGLPLAEVTSWLTRMRDFGYCGFWYDGEYPLYAETILKSPLPAFRMVATPTQSSSQETSMATIDQNLTQAHLQTIWHLANPKVEWDLKAAIQQLWILLVQNHPEINIGSPTEEKERDETVGGQRIRYRVFTSGRVLIWFADTGITCII